MKVMLINIIGLQLVILFHLMIGFRIYLDYCEYMQRIKNEINNKSLKKKLHDPDELINVYENLGGM